MRTANYIFYKQAHDFAKLTSSDIEKIKSDSIQEAIDKYARYGKELGQVNVRRKYPIPPENYPGNRE